MDTSVDQNRLRELMVESSDLHADSMRDMQPKLSDYVVAVKDTEEDRRRSLGRGALIAGVTGAGLLVGAGRASAAGSSSNDVLVLRTAAALENLAVFTYKTALTLPFIGGSTAIPLVKAFVTKTMAQHSEHAKAFNAAAMSAGGKAQDATDPKYTTIVKAAVPSLTGPAAVVGLAITLEDVAAQTYVKDAALVSTATLRSLFVSVAAVEAQHKAILLAVQALVKGGATDLLVLGPPAAKLPAAAGSVGFPDAFYSTKMASPASEGSA